jgi:ABC-2 type transport system ATP-binding protein
MPEWVIETERLTKIYNSAYIALNGAHLKVPVGSVYGLIGPNGSGKTTTIRLLLGLHTPSAGTAKVFGEVMTPNAVDLRQRIGYLPTNPQFPGDMNPITYLDFVGRLFGIPTETRKPRLAALLRAVGLSTTGSQKIKSLSTGMKTRLGIAASLMNDPDLLIWDEPTAGLDPEGRKYTVQLIQELGRSKTIFVSSHDLGDLEKVCDYVGILSDGKLIFNGPIDDMKQYRQTNVIELEVEGDVDAFCAQLDGIEWERTPGVVRLTLAAREDLGPIMLNVMTLLTNTDIKLNGLKAAREEMVDAFIRLMNEERSHGFSQILQSVSGNSTTRFDQLEPLVGRADMGAADDGSTADHAADGDG